MTIANREAPVQLAPSRSALARRFFARIGYAYLLGISVPVFGFVFDLILAPGVQFIQLVRQFAGTLALVVITNTVSIGVVTFTSHLNKFSRRLWLILPPSMSVLTGLLLAILHIVGINELYENTLDAFAVGAVAGLFVGVAYSLSIPGLRQDTLLKQSRRAIIISGVIGIQLGVYTLVRGGDPTSSSEILVYDLLSTIISVPLSVMGMLLSFVLGIELGDRYVER